MQHTDLLQPVWCWDHLGEVFREFPDQILDDLLVSISMIYVTHLYCCLTKIYCPLHLPIENTKYALTDWIGLESAFCPSSFHLLNQDVVLEDY